MPALTASTPSRATLPSGSSPRASRRSPYLRLSQPSTGTIAAIDSDDARGHHRERRTDGAAGALHLPADQSQASGIPTQSTEPPEEHHGHEHEGAQHLPGAILRTPRSTSGSRLRQSAS